MISHASGWRTLDLSAQLVSRSMSAARGAVGAPAEALGLVEVEVVALLDKASGRLAVAIEVHVVVELAQVVDRPAGAGRVVRGARVLHEPVEDSEVRINVKVSADRAEIFVRVEGLAERRLLRLGTTVSEATKRQRVISPGSTAEAGSCALQIPSPGAASTPVPSSTIASGVSALNALAIVDRDTSDRGDRTGDLSGQGERPGYRLRWILRDQAEDRPASWPPALPVPGVAVSKYTCGAGASGSLVVHDERLQCRPAGAVLIPVHESWVRAVDDHQLGHAAARRGYFANSRSGCGCPRWSPGSDPGPAV